MASAADEHPIRGRKEAIGELIKSYQNKYSNGKSEESSVFFINPLVSFVVTGSGISVQAAEDIPSGVTLMKVPQAERVALANVASNGLNKILKDIKAKYCSIEHQDVDGIGGCVHDVYRHGDICLAVHIMHDLAQEKLYTKAWPSVKDFRQDYYPIWDPKDDELPQLLKGTYTLQNLQRYAQSLRYTFDEVVKPILLKAKPIEDYLPAIFQGESANQTEDLWEAFLYASSLIRSRSHEGSMPDEPEIIPIIDLINGYPSSCKDKINVDIKRVSGVVRASSIVTVKEIKAGQDIFIAYGEIRASACLIRYAYCPREVVYNSLASLDVILLRVPTFLGPPDKVRADACKKSGFPSTPKAIEEDFFFHLSYEDLVTYINSGIFEGETEQFKGVRQFLLLCHLLDDEAVRLNLATGRLRANIINPIRIGQLLLLVLDHTITALTSLDTTTNAEDLEKASSSRHDIAVAHRVRICQRDTLAQWRHAFSQRYRMLSEHVQLKDYYDEFLSEMHLRDQFCPNLPRMKAPQCLMESRGCIVCGRTVNLKGCSKCKVVKYCGREHQIKDWKQGHKKSCNAT